MESGQPEDPITSPSRDSWSINWPGAITVLIVAVVVLLVTQLRGDDDSTDASSAATSTVSATTDVVSATTSSTVAATTTTNAATTTSTTIARRQVLIRGEVKPCRFGAECLVAHFEIEGFDPHPGRFTCLYPNSRSDFGFNDDDVEDACLTGDEGDTITIEVDGVRSATISAENLDGEP